jgi:hypothetical protein
MSLFIILPLLAMFVLAAVFVVTFLRQGLRTALIALGVGFAVFIVLFALAIFVTMPGIRT